jgi:hypothetical protein
MYPEMMKEEKGNNKDKSDHEEKGALYALYLPIFMAQLPPPLPVLLCTLIIFSYYHLSLLLPYPCLGVTMYPEMMEEEKGNNKDNSDNKDKSDDKMNAQGPLDSTVNIYIPTFLP